MSNAIRSTRRAARRRKIGSKRDQRRKEQAKMNRFKAEQRRQREAVAHKGPPGLGRI
jgi:hypothetical protein